MRVGEELAGLGSISVGGSILTLDVFWLFKFSFLYAINLKSSYFDDRFSTTQVLGIHFESEV